jgi:hypothetical protein
MSKIVLGEMVILSGCGVEDNKWRKKKENNLIFFGPILCMDY